LLTNFELKNHDMQNLSTNVGSDISYTKKTKMKERIISNI